NELASKGEKILAIADARRFYFGPRVESCVVFNRNPFAEAAAAKSPAELLAWVRDHGYHFLFMNWSEMHRLRKSRYGFWKSINEGLFTRLTAAGLRPIEQFSITENGPPYATLFEAP
ncbi:MAG TPA: hypothetical protein VMV81_00965, partial [Phycisphaerae bacterium]|nr:hypothetical protein [Phycisphaerae bacterium]